MKLREYQKEAINALNDYFESCSDGAPILALPTGTGKSVIIANYIKNLYDRNGKTNIIMLTHVKELVEQNFKKLLEVWPGAPVGVYSAGLKRKDTINPIIFATIQSIVNKKEEFKNTDMIIIDECHRVSTNTETTYQKFINYIKQFKPNLKVIGLTATPYRLDNGYLVNGNLFTEIIHDLTTYDNFNMLVEKGYLSELTTKKMANKYDLAGIKKSCGDYSIKDMDEKLNIYSTNALIINEILEKAEDRKHILIFAINIDHITNLRDEFLRRGEVAGVVHSQISSEERATTLQKFKNGEFKYLINCDVLTTGFDFPGIDCIAVLRPTTSTSLWVQMVGRGTRVAENKKNCLILDFAGNIERLGAVNDPVIKLPGKKQDKTQVNIKSCKVCSTYIHISYKICPCCGYEFPREEVGEDLDTVASDLDIITKNPIRKLATVKHAYAMLHVNDNNLFIRFIFKTDIGNFSNLTLSWETSTPARKEYFKDLLLNGYHVDSTREFYELIKGGKFPKIAGVKVNNQKNIVAIYKNENDFLNEKKKTS